MQDPTEAPATFAQPVDPGEGGDEAVLAAGDDSSAAAVHRRRHRVRRATSARCFSAGAAGHARGGRPAALVQGGQLPADQMEPQCLQLLGQGSVRTGRHRLALEGPHLSSHLAQEVTQALEILLGGRQPPLGPFPSATMFQDPGRLLDHGPPVLGPGVQDLIELPLAHDHVLGAADAGIGQQLLDVEEPTGLAVEAYSLSPDRNRVRVMVISAKPPGGGRPGCRW